MTTFRKRRNSDVWHFCRNCSNWPTAGYEERPARPSKGEFCDQCRAKRDRGECR